MPLCFHQTRKSIKHKRKTFFNSVNFDAPRNAIKNQVQLFAIRRKIIDTGFVETMFILKPNESDLPRAWIPGSIKTISKEGLEEIPFLSFESSSEMVRIESEAFR
jgi:hypothetical protein